ncbi:hypothetical protein [Rhodopirellula europaea]|uniref:Uncharacterized protein n=1 Tax=Rhodopirellula europaea SH398 TaxID=1263868 RepID=M5S773_9BACT|nr:hypothetical protein [Rhodopirellula europaea]EMI23512.1 hypothetical protein RESH_05925 [Rhodopirellula europaea SH398]MCR9211221.1 hypothetical protein [bacterium]
MEGLWFCTEAALPELSVSLIFMGAILKRYRKPICRNGRSDVTITTNQYVTPILTDRKRSVLPSRLKSNHRIGPHPDIALASVAMRPSPENTLVAYGLCERWKRGFAPLCSAFM